MRPPKRRYLAEWQAIGARHPRLGTSTILIRHYVSDEMAFRYMPQHLAAPHLPAGQYRLSRWPEGPSQPTPIGWLYKKAASDG